ncbi:MAG: ketoacyl-ACP synthase III [bacterium]|nr:ketoacyl-ACP synthase III [bacterium]
MNRSVFVGCGAYLPSKIVTNEDLSKVVDTSHDWIVSRTGISSRHIAAEGELTSDLGAQAAKQALETAEVSPEGVDLIVVATATPDDTFPSTATSIQRKIGAINAFAFDVSAVCSGYLLALSVANNAVRLGSAKTALVIGAETFSRILDMKDRQSCVLFGDGAGAVILRAEKGNPSLQERGIIDIKMHSDGRYRDILYTDGGASSTKTTGYIRMEGREVFRHAVEKLTASAEDTLQRHNLTSEDIDWMIPHQANIRIIDAVAKKLSLPKEKVITTVDHHANTSAASIPLALNEAVQSGKLKAGDLVLHEAIGGGLTWGSALVRW